jgi:Holliday junction resolvase-like predicted endonuclease
LQETEVSKIKKDTGVIVEIHHNTKGAVNEYLATAWLLKEGFDIFRNVSPRGRADLVIRDWDNDEWISVDVKSEHFDLRGTDKMNEGQRATAKEYASSNIRYLVVTDDGACRWYEDLDHPKNGEDFTGEDYWICPTSGHRFLHPSHFMSRKEWSFFAYWAIEYHGAHLTQHQIDTCWIVRRAPNIKPRDLTEPQERVMKKILLESYQRVIGQHRPANDNTTQVEVAA